MDVLRTAFQTALVLEWAAAVATAVVATEVSLRLMAGQLSFEVALAVLIITPEFFLPLRNLAIRYHSGSAGETAAERLLALGAAPDPRDVVTTSVVTTTTVVPAGATPKATTRVASTPPGLIPPASALRPPAISFDDVWFAYPDRSAALCGIGSSTQAS